MFIQPCADGLTASHRAPFVPSGSRFSPSYFRVGGRGFEFAFAVTHDLSVTIYVVDMKLTSLVVDPEMAFGVSYHGASCGDGWKFAPVMISGNPIHGPTSQAKCPS